MARDPRKEGRRKKRGKKSASGSRGASGSARTSASKVAKAAKSHRSAGSATLKWELREARARQAATAEILKIIASSPSDVKPVFDVIVETSRTLCRAEASTIFTLHDGRFHVVAFAGAETALLQYMKSHPIRVEQKGSALARAARERRTIHIPNTAEYLEVDDTGIIGMGGSRATLTVPLMRDGLVVGGISLRRSHVTPFTSRQVEAIESFADQAVIAIENVRLFNKTKEALARQTATSEVLQVISSSPGDLKPVFEQMLAKAMRLCEAQCGFIYQGEQGAMRAVAEIGVPRAFAEYRRQHLHTGGAATPIDTMRATRKPAHVHDARDSEPYHSGNPNAVAGVDLGGARTVLYVPMIRNDDIVGVINLYRHEVRPFTDEQIALLENFASQAVIAIENTRLFNETKESLQQQTATADVLGVIASSPTDVKPVLDAIVESACKLCEANDSYVALKDGDDLVFRAQHGSIPVAYNRRPINRQWPAGRAVVDGIPIHLHDVLSDEGDDFPDGREIARRDGARTVLTVPLMREGASIGVIILRRTEVQPFTDKQMALLKTFADQAVIAIENTRLFNETKEALARQTATADVLKVIASSPSNLQPVFDAIAERSKELIGAHSTTVARYTDGIIDLAAFTPVSPEADAALRALFPMQRSDDLSQFDRIIGGQIATISDVESEIENSAVREMARARGWRSRLLVPLKEDTGVIGWISITREEAGGFAEKDVELLQTFADQAVIAISNVELFQQVQERTRELSQSLDDLRAAQDRLVQTEKLASLGQLTAGIAHEIKNPLNFVNNFSALSVELTDELNDVLRKAELAEKIQQDVDELTQLLKSNLEKVVQHGKRADSIVKNMLLHSREGSGEQRAADINALVEESLNLAYHGARAEKSGFNITLQREFDTGAGAVELYPQEMTRALLNLISNGFYAASKRKAENGEAAFEPTLLATTKDLGNAVEIRIRDNGTGIPPEVKEKMFNPFFTTKPAGEGTGLGLSMTHDIIVKQHGGTIDVATEPGNFTEFILVLPRANGLQGKIRGQA